MERQSLADGFWRKGPWTPQEDKLLLEHVDLHGDGRWNSVSKLTGLRRSGKSCRLRWVNYLRPDLKRGKITPEEELIIMELHALWGNRWSTIARSLPGRTDNEIKNYWRTHFKKSKPSENARRLRPRPRLLKHLRKEEEEYQKTAAAAGAALKDERRREEEEEEMQMDDVIRTTTAMLSQMAEQAALEREIMAYSMCMLQGAVDSCGGGGGWLTAEEVVEGGGGWWPGSLWNLEE